MTSPFITGNCAKCGKIKKIYRTKKLCVKCNRELKWEAEKEKICSELDNGRVYTIVLPVDGSNIYFSVYPEKTYGDYTGKELIRKYLSRKVWKYGKVRKTDSARRYHYMHKERYGNLSYSDIEKAKRLGNVWNDTTFERYKRRLDKLDGEEKKKYLNSLKASSDDEFGYGNEGNRFFYQSIESKRLMEMAEIESADY